MDGVQLPHGYRASTRKQFHKLPCNSWYSFDRPQKDERLSRLCSHPVVLNSRRLCYEFSASATMPLTFSRFHWFLVTHFRPMSSFYTLWKHQKIRGFNMFSEGVETGRKSEMGSYYMFKIFFSVKNCLKYIPHCFDVDVSSFVELIIN